MLERVTLTNLTKAFGDHQAVADVSLSIEPGEFLVLVGPSGCGKTTLLRMIAGLELPTSGQIYIGDRDVTRIPPGKRDVAMIFQNYALYPHMTVYKNLAYGPVTRGEPKHTVAARVAEVADLLGLTEFLQHRPATLSGGQRQRVAVGRVMMRRPSVFLMDEPLSNLDAGLRVVMRGELVRLHRSLDATTIYVTHDQVEAMTMGTRIAVVKDGSIVQVASPQDLYDNPHDTFVATFVGTPRMQMYGGELISNGDEHALQTLGRRVPLGCDQGFVTALAPDGARALLVGIRPSDITEHFPDDPSSTMTAQVPGKIELVETLGSEAYVTMRTPTDEIVTGRFAPHRNLRPGDDVVMDVHTDALYLFDKETGRSLRNRHTGMRPVGARAGSTSAQ